MPNIFVDIPVDGDWPSPQDMGARNAIIDELDTLKLGEFGGSGGGLGSMDFSYTVTDVVAAEAALKQLLAKHLPNREYSIDITED